MQERSLRDREEGEVRERERVSKRASKQHKHQARIEV